MQDYKNKKIFITGVAGFIGFHLAKKLIEIGFTVIGIDNLNDYYDINLKYARLKELGISTNDNVKFISNQNRFIFFTI